MGRYIDADILIQDTIQEYARSKQYRDAIIRMVNKAPTVEPKRGEWLPDENGDFRCTNCGRIAEWEFFEDNFCPNCGADMRGESDGNK